MAQDPSDGEVTSVLDAVTVKLNAICARSRHG
jgi:hypothetical protein